jgi:hypothetical protein
MAFLFSGLLVISRRRTTLKSPAYPTTFLACVEGDHSICEHVDSESNFTWICQCDCHAQDRVAHTGDYSVFPVPPESVQVVLRYAPKSDGVSLDVLPVEVASPFGERRRRWSDA